MLGLGPNRQDQSLLKSYWVSSSSLLKLVLRFAIFDMCLLGFSLKSEMCMCREAEGGRAFDTFYLSEIG